MPGAGKSTVAASLKEKGFYLITMGDAVRDEAKQQNLELTDANLGNLMLNLRKDLGPGAIAHLVLRKIARDHNNSKNLVIDGIRSIAEVQVLKNLGTVKLLAIHASVNTRFGHLKVRGRSDDPSNLDDFSNRDKRELNVGISEAIAMADETLSNNELTTGELKEKAFRIVRRWINESNQ
jgi:dephospho-CoA kinase